MVLISRRPALVGTTHRLICPGGWEERETQSVMKPGGETWGAVGRKAPRRTGERRDGPDAVIAKMMCHKMSNADAKCNK